MAVIEPGRVAREHLPVAIRATSGKIPQRHIRTYTGWCDIGDRRLFLHADGAIGPDGPVGDVGVSLPPPLKGYALPEPPSIEQLAEDLERMLDTLLKLNLNIIIPLFAGIYRALLGSADFSIHLVGPTGTFKTALLNVVLKCFGTAAKPASWTSTANYNETLAFHAKDVPLGLDDFAPSGSQYDVNRSHHEADRLIRGQGNQSGRGRARQDGSLRPVKPSRALIISTGEEIPRGQSLRARMAVVQVRPDDVDPYLLSLAQEAAAEGVFARVTSAYVRHLAEAGLPDVAGEIVRLRSEIEAAHRRTPEIVANFQIGWDRFLQFAVEYAGLSRDEGDALRSMGHEALLTMVVEQELHQQSEDPARRAILLLESALASGAAHVAGANGDCPGNQRAWGWRKADVVVGWMPQGDRVGWTKDGHLYVESEAFYTLVQRLAIQRGTSLGLTPETLHKRLHEGGYLLSRDATRNTLTIRKVLGGRRRNVLHLNLAVTDENNGDEVPF